MKKKIMALSILSGVAITASLVVGAGIATHGFTKGFAGVEDPTGYPMLLDGSHNLLTNGSGTGQFELSDPNNKISVIYSGKVQDKFLYQIIR